MCRMLVLVLLIGLVVMAQVPPAPAPAVTAFAAVAATPAPPQFRRGTLHIYQESRKVTMTVEVADTTETRSYGLMSRKTLPENAGMLFVFDEDGKWGFWMKNTLIPLSIGFIDGKRRLLEVQDMAVPADPSNGPFPIYEPRAPYRYALEVNQGFFQRKGITAGARFEFVPAK